MDRDSNAGIRLYARPRQIYARAESFVRLRAGAAVVVLALREPPRLPQMVSGLPLDSCRGCRRAAWQLRACERMIPVRLNLNRRLIP